MAKRSRKRFARSTKNKAGCMWGLINLFDFRQGHSNQKLLSDRKHGIGKPVGTKYSRSKVDLLSDLEDTEEVDDLNDSGGEEANLGMPSVKTLMEAEMFRVQPSKKIPSDEVERIQSELGLDVHKVKNYNQPTDESGMVPDFVNATKTPASMQTHQPNCMNPTDKSSGNFDLAEFLMKFYGDNHQFQSNHVDCECTTGQNPFPQIFDSTDGSNPQLDGNEFFLQEDLEAVAETFLAQQFIDAKQLNRTAESKEFMNAIEILNSNKDLLLNLLKDPNSPLLRHIQGHHNAKFGNKFELESKKYLEANEGISSSTRSEEPKDDKLSNRQSRYSFFRKKDKLKERKPAKESEDSRTLNRIVVLKPSTIKSSSITISPSSSTQSLHSLTCPKDGERVVSHFSLKEIRRRLRNVMGESKNEQCAISMDGVLHKIPYGSSKSSDEAAKPCAGDNTEHSSQSSIMSNKRDKKAMARDFQLEIKLGDCGRVNTKATAQPSDSQSFYDEARRHLVEILDAGDCNDLQTTSQVSKPLEKLLSLQEYNMLSPRFSPGRDKAPEISPTQKSIGENNSNQSSQMIQDLEEASQTDDPNIVDEVADVNPIPIDTHNEEEASVRDDLNTGITDITEVANIDVHPESDGDELAIMSARCMEEGSSPKPESSLGKSTETPFEISSFILVQSPKNLESILEKPERPSPISVLDPFFSEEVNSPRSAANLHVETLFCPQNSHFEEDDSHAEALSLSDLGADLRTRMDDKACRFGYLRMVLDVYGLSSDETWSRWLSLDSSLDPFLHDEVGIACTISFEDPKLLFEHINEILMGIQDRLFFEPSVRPILVGSNLTEEVIKGINRRSLCPSPCTLDQLIEKDMEGGGWKYLLHETESVVAEMGDTILEALIEETVQEIWV